MSELKLTKTGIPNKCCECGKLLKVEWYAENNDMARSGQGKCPPCAGIKPKSKPKRTQRPKQTELKSVEKLRSEQ